MDEKKNLTPNAIEDDKLDEVAGGAGLGDYFKKVNELSKKLASECKQENEQP